MSWLYNLLIALATNLIEKAFDYIKNRIEYQRALAALKSTSKEKLKEIMLETNPEVRAQRLKDLLESFNG